MGPVFFWASNRSRTASSRRRHPAALLHPRRLKAGVDPMGCRIAFILLLSFSLAMLGCGGVNHSTVGPTPTPSPSNPSGTTIPAADHVFVVLLENHAFALVIGSPSMPYLNSLATQPALATNYFANTHPSIGNYFMLTTGNVETNNDAVPGTISSDNMPRAFAAAGKTWKAYMESLPSVGYIGGDMYPYFKHHDPFVYLTDVLNSSAEKANVAPFTQLAADMGAGSLPNYAFIAPNAEHDAHDCPSRGSVVLENGKPSASGAPCKSHIGPPRTSPPGGNHGFTIPFSAQPLREGSAVCAYTVP